MQSQHSAFNRMSDGELLAEARRLAGREREATAELVALLAEVDARRLYLGAGYSSLFSYCVQSLGLSEDAAYYRIEAARAARKFPAILQRLSEGALTLTAVRLLAPHLTDDNHCAVLEEARGRTKREVESIVARLQPRPDVPSLVRKLPASRVDRATIAVAADGTTWRPAGSGRRPSDNTSGGESLLSDAARPSVTGSKPETQSTESRTVTSAASNTVRNPALEVALPVFICRPSAVVEPLAPQRYKIQLTVGEDTHVKLRRAQGLLRHVVPDGDLAQVFDRALTLLVNHLERERCAARKRDREPAASTTQARDGRRGARGRRKSRTRSMVTGRALRLANETSDVVGTVPVSAARANRETTEGRDNARDRPAPGVSSEEQLVPARVATTRRGRRRTRHIPAVVKREVWRRDGGRCTYVGTEGRCAETGRLEYHHVVPYANGGETTASNVRLLCARHNQAEAERFFGDGGFPGEP